MCVCVCEREKGKPPPNDRSQNREQSRRSDQQAQSTLPPRRVNNARPNPRRGGRLAPAAVGTGARVRDRRPHKGGSAHLIDHGGRVDVVEVERLTPVRRRVRVDGHGPREARVAGREAARGQPEAHGEVVHVAVGRGGLVGDCVGEAVVLVVLLLVRVARGRSVLQAGGVVGDVVGEEAGVGLAHLGVFVVVVVLAGGGGTEGEGEGGHEG